MSREAMQLALEALIFAQYEDEEYDDACDQKVREARDALRQALAQPEQEPVAWLSEGGDVSRSKRYMDEMGFKCNPLYTAPPKREWVGLTLSEAEDFYEKHTDRAELINAIDKFLVEKNT